MQAKRTQAKGVGRPASAPTTQPQVMKANNHLHPLHHPRPHLHLLPPSSPQSRGRGRAATVPMWLRRKEEQKLQPPPQPQKQATMALAWPADLNSSAYNHHPQLLFRSLLAFSADVSSRTSGPVTAACGASRRGFAAIVYGRGVFSNAGARAVRMCTHDSISQLNNHARVP